LANQPCLPPLSDDMGDVALSIRVKLLRILETGQFERVGDHQPIRVDVRIITATSRNLERLVAQGRFREDLFVRINVKGHGIATGQVKIAQVERLGIGC